MLRLSIPNLADSTIDAVTKVIRSGQLVHGPECEAFENELAAYLGCAEVVLVSSGTAALHLALIALEIGPGDAVLVPDFTFPATANVVRMVGATPVIVDVDPDNYCIDLARLQQTITTWTGAQKLRAIIPVHEFGHPVDMDALLAIARHHDLAVVEDAACALGAVHNAKKIGTFGEIGCFSFHPRKTLTTGEGGALATHDQNLAQRLRRLRNHGMERSAMGMHFSEPGLNYRLTNFQAAMGRTQLPHLDNWIALRRNLAQEYRVLLEPLVQENKLTLPAEHCGHSWQTFMVKLNPDFKRESVIASLRNLGFESNLGAQSLSALGLYGEASSNTIGAALFRHGLALPFCEQYTLDDAQQFSIALTETLRK